ncbi:hypothetical protein XI06_05380 [Bradyrhizobium sp. CCBAU 11434]|nr:hypothetical protein [Bradyrhizobium sp. CCBAU 11434]
MRQIYRVPGTSIVDVVTLLIWKKPVIAGVVLDQKFRIPAQLTKSSGHFGGLSCGELVRFRGLSSRRCLARLRAR